MFVFALFFRRRPNIQRVVSSCSCPSVRMAEARNNYGAVGSSQSIDSDDNQRVRSVDSFYGDQLAQTEGQGAKVGFQSMVKESENQSDALQRPTRVSFGSDQPSNLCQGTVSPISTRHVAFVAEETQPNDAWTMIDNHRGSDSFSDSISRVRVLTNTSVAYHTHSEGEECHESDLTALSFHRNLQSSPWRRSRFSKRGVMVSDSFVNECVCCCSIL